MLYTNNNLVPVKDDESYVDEDGTKYPYNYHKDEIPGLFVVTETEPVVPTGKVITGFHINSEHIQVWDLRDKTPEELAAEQEETRVIPSVAILQSPNGTPFKVMVDDNGNLETQPLSEDDDGDA